LVKRLALVQINAGGSGRIFEWIVEIREDIPVPG
jgi:hypothetical protein